MAAGRQYLVPGRSFRTDIAARQYLVPGQAFVSEQGLVNVDWLPRRPPAPVVTPEVVQPRIRWNQGLQPPPAPVVNETSWIKVRSVPPAPLPTVVNPLPARGWLYSPFSPPPPPPVFPISPLARAYQLIDGALMNIAISILNVIRLSVDGLTLTFEVPNSVFDGGGNTNLTVNKPSTGDDATMKWTTGDSTRALFGTLGDDNLSFKVSPDGSSFSTGMVIDNATGRTQLAQDRNTLATSAHDARTLIYTVEELVTLSGATTDSSIVMPQGSIVLAVSERVVTTITGPASFEYGTSGTPNQFGSGLALAAGNFNYGNIGPTAFYADTPVRFTAVGGGGSFTGGKVRMAIHYILIQPPQS